MADPSCNTTFAFNVKTEAARDRDDLREGLRVQLEAVPGRKVGFTLHASFTESGCTLRRG